MVKLISEQTAYLCGEIPLEMELNKNIGALIRQLRTTCEMIQSELAAKVCITWLNLSDIEYGKRAVSIDVLERIAEVFHLKLSTLIARAEKYEMEFDAITKVVPKMPITRSVNK